jgi:hypothetical protein
MKLMMIRVVIALLVTASITSTAQAQERIASPEKLARAVYSAPAAAALQPPAPPRDSRLNGFLIGFIAGAVPGIMLGMGINSYCNNESSSDCPIAIPIVGALFGFAGGGIGYAIDGAIGQSVTVGRPRPSPGVRFSFRF